jgi:hypothetical protein
VLHVFDGKQQVQIRLDSPALLSLWKVMDLWAGKQNPQGEK